MKKTYKIFLSVFISLMIFSCNTTENIQSKDTTAEETIKKTQEDVAEEISNTISSETKEEHSSNFEESTEKPEQKEQAPDNKISSSPLLTLPPEEQKQENQINEIEKVSDEDSKFTKESEQAPTTDEREKISEYEIFEEPEIEIHDLNENIPQENEDAELKIIEGNANQEEKEQKTEQNSDSKISSETAENTSELAPPNTTDTQGQTENKKAEITQVETNNSELKKQEIKTELNEQIVEEKLSEKILPSHSRSVTLKLWQYLDIDYPGTGWIFIGEADDTNLFNYFGRKLGTGNTTFSLQAKKSGTTLLHFYKNDALTGEYIDDYLKVEVLNETSYGRVKAPSYAEIIPAKPQRRIERENGTSEASPQIEEKKIQTNITEQNSENSSKKDTAASNASETPLSDLDAKSANSQTAASTVKTVIQNTENNKTESSTPISSQSDKIVENQEIQAEPAVEITEQPLEIDESLLEKAKKDFADKQYKSALDKATQYYNSSSSKLDEALYLIAQIYESESSIKNIKYAIDSYDSLLKLYPASKYWKDANKRLIYLKRFYIDIR